MPLPLTIAAALLTLAGALFVWNQIADANARARQILADELAGQPTEPMLLTHEFQPVSGELKRVDAAPATVWEEYPKLGARHALANVDTQSMPRIEDV